MAEVDYIFKRGLDSQCSYVILLSLLAFDAIGYSSNSINRRPARPVHNFSKRPV